MRRLLALTAMLLAMRTTVLPAASDSVPWFEHYEKGEAALRNQYWAEAIEELTQAIQERGEPGIGVQTHGMNLINYLPYLRLGIAYFNFGQFDAALQAFDTEMRAGAIKGSPSDQQNLIEFRKLARDGLASVVAGSLEEARNLERKGQLDKALEALERGLSVGGRSPEMDAAMRRLRELLQMQKKERDLESRFRRLLAEGRSLSGSGQHAKASSVLRQALMLKPTAEASELLARSQEKLAAELGSSLDAEARTRTIADALAEAGKLEQEGKLADALELHQRVLALDPRNSQGMVAQFRLIQEVSESEQRKSKMQEVDRLIKDGADHLAHARYDQAVSALSSSLSLDPDNTTARGLLWRAFSARTQAVPARAASTSAPRLPPIIAFLNAPNAVDSEERSEQRVSSPAFELSGVVLSDQPQVELTLLQSLPGVADSAPGDEHVAAKRTLAAGELKGNLYRHHFDERFDLSEGLSRLKVVVEDPKGLISEEVYRVRYLRPFTRSPWLYAIAGSAGVAALAAVQGFRVRRRRQLLKRRFNPFVAGAPVLDDDLFVGREVLLSRILETIHNNSILLFGERRIGKTSLQHHLKKRLLRLEDPKFEFHPVYIDLEGTPEERFFERLSQDIFEELSPILDGARPARGLPEGAAYDYQAFVRDLQHVLRILRARSSKKVKLVLLIDEVDELNNYDPRINQKLRSLFMKSFAEDIVAVVSGVGIKKHWASEGSPWYNFFEEIEVKPFTREDARHLITRPIRGVFMIAKEAVERIIERTECRPYLIQRFCVALVNRMHNEGRRRITVADVDAIRSLLGGTEGIKSSEGAGG